MTVRTLTLPRLVAGRDFAPQMVETILGDVTGDDVTVNCSELLTGSPSFASGLVQAILVDGHAARMTLANAPMTFAGYITDAVADYKVGDRFDLQSPQLSSR